jgi:hypothetical protein
VAGGHTLEVGDDGVHLTAEQEVYAVYLSRGDRL